MVTGSQPVRRRPRLTPAAGLAAAFHGVAFAVLMLAGLGLLLVMLALVILTALGFGVLLLDGGLPGDQRILLALLLVGAGLGIARFIVPATASVRFAKALDRSVTGSMNDLAKHATSLLAEGDMDQVQNDPRVIEVYLGA